MRDRRRAGDQQDVGRAAQEPGERDLHRRRAEPLGHPGQRRRLQRAEAPEREERNVGDPGRREVVDERVVRPVREVVRVLDADDLRDPPPLGDLPGRHVAEPDPAHQTLALKIRQHGERRLDGALGRSRHVEHDAQVDDIERVHAEMAQVVVDRAGEILRREGRIPRRVRSPLRTDFGDDDEIVRIGMKRLADDLVGHVRAVEVARIDVVHAAGDRLAQDGDGAVPVLRRAEHVRAGELHRAVAQTPHQAIA